LKPETQKMKRLIQRASLSPFYQRKFGSFKGYRMRDIATFSEKIPPLTLEELVEEKIRSGNPYSLRWCMERSPLVVFQLEYDTETPLYLPLDRSGLKGYAEALTRCWSLLGLGKGDRVAIFDYGTSPVSYLSSASYTPYLAGGAAEALGCLPICNDGVANMSQRAVEILRFIRPRILFLRSDCLQPLARDAEGAALRLSDYVRALVVAESEGALSHIDQEAFERRLGVPIYRMVRIDVAMFLAVECPQCRLLHTWQDLYLVENIQEDNEEILNGDVRSPLLITNWFGLACPTLRYLSQIKGTVVSPGCPNGPNDQRIAL
jgi:phenylacetate-coenzyme A ligase PaaK-like adenylate-forming protein